MANRSRYRRDKCCGMRIEKTCYIFAIVNVVMVGLCVLTCFGTMGFLISRVFVSSIDNSFALYEATWTVIYPAYAVVCVLVAIYGTYSILLLRGIQMNKPKLMKAYLLCGLIVEMLMIMVTAIYIAVVANLRSRHYVILNVGLALAIVICVVYACALCLVRRAYLILSSKSKRNYILNEQTVLYFSENR